MKCLVILLGFLLCRDALTAQDLMKSLEDSVVRKTYVTSAFKSTRVINGQSMEMLGAGVLDVRILHRFDPLSEGIQEFFGLDHASMRLGFDYGISDNLTIGVGRSTFNKELDGFLKYRILRQSTGPGASPFSVVLVGGMCYETYTNKDTSKEVTYDHRVAYFFQVVAGRKFSERFSLQLTPSLVHRNIVSPADANDIYAMGLGTRFKISRRVAFVLDYFYVFNGLPHDVGSNPLSIGVDIETGGHVFQLHFSNSAGMNE